MGRVLFKVSKENMTNSNPVISCKNVWKLFGFAPEKYLKNLPENKTYEEIQADGYIAGVKDVSVDVFKGEMLVIMGLSGCLLYTSPSPRDS